jgi:AcrR family transcriptional regulator
MPRSVTNPAAERARRRYAVAIRSLAANKALDAITLRDVCLRAGMGRHTFFQLFENLEEAKVFASQGRWGRAC